VRRTIVVEPHPYQRQDARGIPAEPEVAAVVARAGLSGGDAGVAEITRAPRRAAIQHSLEKRGHQVRGLLGNAALRIGPGRRGGSGLRAPLKLDPQQDIRRSPVPSAGDRREDGRHLER